MSAPAGLAELNAWPVEKAREYLLRCCGCARWAEEMIRLRPFKDKAAVLAAADAVWAKTRAKDWLEAFSHHPRIGGKDASTRCGDAAVEQAAVAAASEVVLDALAQGNADYEAKFGHIFIVCATGKTAAEMLDLFKSRLRNDPKTEKRIAAGEQAKITKIRLEKLLI